MTPFDGWYGLFCFYLSGCYTGPFSGNLVSLLALPRFQFPPGHPLKLAVSVLAFFLSNNAIKKIGVTRTSSFIGISTLVSILSGIVFLGETFSPFQAWQLSWLSWVSICPIVGRVWERLQKYGKHAMLREEGGMKMLKSIQSGQIKKFVAIVILGFLPSFVAALSCSSGCSLFMGTGYSDPNLVDPLSGSGTLQ